MNESQIRQDIVEIGRRIWLRGYVAANDGNISVRMPDDTILTTPTGVSKGFLTPDMIIKVDLTGKRLEGALKPSSEIKMHIAVYEARPDVKAVVHAHPPVSTGFAVAGLSLENCVLPEVIISLGGIPLTDYGTPSTTEIPNAIRPYLQQYDAFLLANHGVLTIGTDVYSAYHKMETTEHFAQISLNARLLGGEKLLCHTRVEQLKEVGEKMGLPRKPYCIECGGECGACEAVKNTRSPGPIAEDLAGQDLASLVREVTNRVLQKIKE